MCPICVSANSAFGAHGLKSASKLPSESEIRGVGVLRARKLGRARVLTEAHHVKVNHAICELMIYVANVKNDSFYLFCDEFCDPCFSSYRHTCNMQSLCRHPHQLWRDPKRTVGSLKCL